MMVTFARGIRAIGATRDDADAAGDRPVPGDGAGFLNPNTRPRATAGDDGAPSIRPRPRGGFRRTFTAVESRAARRRRAADKRPTSPAASAKSRAARRSEHRARVRASTKRARDAADSPNTVPRAAMYVNRA